MSYRLGLNTGFAVNRYSDPMSWCKLVNKCELNYVQLTADLINPSLPNYIIDEQIKQINYFFQAPFSITVFYDPFLF